MVWCVRVFFYPYWKQALAETGERARELGLHVAMAPEGTRSKTGQLGPFKKASQVVRGEEKF